MQNIFDLKKISLLLLLTIVLAFGACSKDASDTSSQSATSAASNRNTASTSSEFDKAYAAADALRLQAAALEYEWRDTESFLLEAKNEFVAGNKDVAMQLVNKAHQQAELAITQAKAEKTAWKSRVPN